MDEKIETCVVCKKELKEGEGRYRLFGKIYCITDGEKRPGILPELRRPKV